MSHRIVIDRNICSGFGSCIDTAPALFTMGADGIATAPADTDDVDAALAASRECPMGAIVVFDESGRELR